MSDDEKEFYRCPNGHGLDDSGCRSICPECSAGLVRLTARELVERANRFHELALVEWQKSERWYKEHAAARERLRDAEKVLAAALQAKREAKGFREMRDTAVRADAALFRWQTAYQEITALEEEPDRNYDIERAWADAKRAAVQALCREAGLKEELPQ